MESGDRDRILFTSYTADWTGPTISLLLLLRSLRNTYDVEVVMPGKGLFSEALEKEGIRYHSLPSLTKGAIPEIRGLVKDNNFDLVYGNNQSATSRNALIAAKLAGVPFVCHVRGMGWHHSWITLGYLRFADSTIAISNAVGESISRFVPSQKLHIVHNGVDTSFLTKDRLASRNFLLGQTGLSGENVVVVNVAHLGERKGQKFAVESMASVVKENPEVHLLLVGGLDRDTKYVDETRQLISSLNLDDNVSIMGFRQDALRLIEGADIYMHSATVEPHGRSVIEAMAAGLPVVAFAADGVKESVDDEETGYLASIGDTKAMSEHILELSQNPDLRHQLGKKGKVRVDNHFSATSTASKVASVIDNVMNRKAARRYLGLSRFWS